MLIKRLWKALIMWKYNLSLEILTKKSIEREGGVKGARSKPKTNNYERHNESFIVVKEHYLYRREFCRGVGYMQCKEISEKKNILNIIRLYRYIYGYVFTWLGSFIYKEWGLLNASQFSSCIQLLLQGSRSSGLSSSMMTEQRYVEGLGSQQGQIVIKDKYVSVSFSLLKI